MNQLCENCHAEPAVHDHHRFPQYKRHRNLYPEYIDHPDNKMRLGLQCHLNKLPGSARWSEKQFCEHFNIEPRSKSGQYKQKVKEMKKLR